MERSVWSRPFGSRRSPKPSRSEAHAAVGVGLVLAAFFLLNDLDAECVEDAHPDRADGERDDCDDHIPEHLFAFPSSRIDKPFRALPGGLVFLPSIGYEKLGMRS